MGSPGTITGCRIENVDKGWGKAKFVADAWTQVGLSGSLCKNEWLDRLSPYEPASLSSAAKRHRRPNEISQETSPWAEVYGAEVVGSLRVR
jgi:hypothetical protein